MNAASSLFSDCCHGEHGDIVAEQLNALHQSFHSDAAFFWIIPNWSSMWDIRY